MILLFKGTNSITNDATTVATTALAISVVSATLIATSYYMKYEKNKTTSDSSSDTITPKCLPESNVGMLEAVAKLGGPEAPGFFLELAKKIQMDDSTSDSRSCSYCHSFRLRIPISPGGAYVIGDYRIARKIFLDPKTERPRFMYKMFQGPMEKTLFTSSMDDLAKVTRKNVAHAFAKTEVQRMNAIAMKHVDNWLQKRLNHFVESGQSFDPASEIVCLTFSVILEAAFEYEATEEDFQFFLFHADSFFREFAFNQMMNPFRKIFGAFIPGVRRATANGKEWLGFARKVLKAYRDNANKSTENTTLIKIFTEATWFQSEAQRESEVLFWIFAGMDTTGYTISNTLTLLAKHPKEQSKVREALLRNPDKIGKDVPEFHNMLQEVKRFRPVGANGSIRETGRDIMVEPHLGEGKEDNNLIKIPKGAVCFLPQMLISHNPNVFGNDVDVFRPDRWENATKAMEDSITYFSLGSRNCPGQLLAVAEMNSILPRILREYSLDIDEEGKLDYFLTMRYSGFKLRATKVN